MENTLKQILVELQSLNQKVSNIETEQQVVKTELQTMEAGISKLHDGQLRIETHLETEVFDKVRALFDAREVQTDVNERIISALDRIEAKIDVLQMETAHIRRIK